MGSVRHRFLVFVLLIAAPLAVAAKRAPWAHESSDISPDESIVWGHLENGFRYALKPHAAKPGVVSMRLVVGVGSLDEKERERGLAHFIEHMAFKGTRHFKPGELISFFQTIGMSYGVDVNAFTYHDKTVYHLELPHNSDVLIEQSLKLYRDYADGILFTEELVDTERAIILREKQARDSPSTRIAQESFRFSFDGTRLADRHPIGLDSVVQQATREDLITFYEKWYRADLMTLVVVGDFDPKSMAASIESAFGGMKKPRGSPPARKIGRLKRTKPFRTGSISLEGVERFTLEVSRAWMEREQRDSWESRKLDALRAFATALFNERCRLMIDGLSDNFANYDRVYGIPYCQLTISSGGEFWWEAFVWMDQLLRQASTYGFTPQEIEQLQKNWLQSSRAGAARYETAEPKMLIDDLVDGIVAERVQADPTEARKIMDAFIEGLNVEEVNEAFVDVWNLKRMSYFMAGDIEDALTRKELKDRLKQDRSYVMLPYVPDLVGAFEYTELGDAGKIVEQGELEALGAQTYRFANNTRLTILQNENENDTARVLVRIGGGMLAFTDDNPGTHSLAMTALFRSGFGEQRIESVFSELRNNVNSFLFGVEDHDAFTYRASTPADGLDEFLKIVTEYLLDPRIDEEAFELAQSKLKQSRELEPDGMNEGYRDLYRMLYPEQPRFHSPSIGDIDRVEAGRIREWLEKPFKEGYLEVAVVGDIDREKVLKLVGETLGALPMRESEKRGFEGVRRLKVKSQTGKRLIEYENGKGDNAASVIVWTIQDELDFRQNAALYVLTSVLETRIRERVRGELGASYSPTVQYVTFPAYDTLRHIRADVDCLKQDASELLDVVLAVATELAQSPIDQEELTAAVAPMEEGIRQAWRDNGYLLENVLYGVQEYPMIVDNAIRYREGLLSTITPEEILEVARLYLEADEALAVAIVPAVDAKLAEKPDWSGQLRAGAAGQ